MGGRGLASKLRVDPAFLNGLLPGRPPTGRASLYAVLDTDEMVARCQRGEAAAFRQHFLRHRTEVARLVFRMVGPRADLEDIIQEVFLQVHRSLKDFRWLCKFTTWLHRVTDNVVLMQPRAARSSAHLDYPLHCDTPP